MNKLILVLLSVSLLVSACSSVSGYRITLTSGEVIELSADEYDCRQLKRSTTVDCSTDGFLRDVTVYFNVEKFETLND